MGKLLYEDLTYKVRKAFFNVYNNLGFGHKENIYEKALEKELAELEINFIKEPTLKVKYKDTEVGAYRPDLVIDNKIIIEIKAVEFLPVSYERQLLHYLKCTEYKLGFLVNFGSDKLFIKRLIWSSSYPCKSSINP